MPSNKTKYDIYISVHKGEPMDSSKFRHTAVWCKPENGSSYYYFHVRGISGEFTYERRKDFDPAYSTSFAELVSVGKTTHSLTPDELDDLMKSVPVNNHDPEFNCQQWVDYALKALYFQKYLTEDQCNDGLNGMLTAIMEAEDENLACW